MFSRITKLVIQSFIYVAKELHVCFNVCRNMSFNQLCKNAVAIICLLPVILSATDIYCVCEISVRTALVAEISI